MKLQTELYSLNPKGVKATSHKQAGNSENPSQSQFTVFCDIVSQEESERPDEENNALKALIEQWIQEHLQSQNLDSLDENKIKASLEYAHERLINFNETSSQQLAVSAIVIATVPSLTDPNEMELLVSGVGDARVFQVDTDRLELIFADPHNSGLKPEASIQERLEYLKNVIGIGDSISVPCHRLPLSPVQNYTVVSHGVLEQISNSELLAAVNAPHSEQLGIEALLSKKSSAGHSIHLKTLTIQADSSSNPLNIPNQVEIDEEKELMNKSPNRQKQQAVKVALTAGVCSLALLVGMQIFRSDSSKEYQQKQLPSEVVNLDSTPSFNGSNFNKLAEENQQLLEKLTQLEQTLLMKTDSIEDLENQLDSFAKMEASRQPSKYLEDLKERNELINRLNLSNTNLRSENASKDQKISYLETTISTLEEVIDNIDQSQDTEFNALKKDFANIKGKANTERDELLKVIQQIEARESLKADELESNKAMIAKLESDINQYAKKIANFTQLEEIKDELEKKNDQLSNLIKEKDSKSTSLSMRIKQLEKEKEKISTSLEKYREQVLQLNHELSDSKVQTRQLEEMTKAMHKKNLEAKALTEKIEDLKTENNVLFSQLQEEKGTINALKKEQVVLAELQSEIETLKNQNRSANSKNIDLLSQITTLEGFRNKYYSEQKLRLQKESLFRNLAQDLKEQKIILNQIQSSRDKIASDLQKSKEDYSKLKQQNEVSRQQASILERPITTPTVSVLPPTGNQQLHRVTSGETLSEISLKYYGTSNRWQEILDANKHLINNEKSIQVGLALVIP